MFPPDISREYDFNYLYVPLAQSNLQSTLVISKLKGPSETLRDIRTSTYQVFRFEDNQISQMNM